MYSEDVLGCRKVLLQERCSLIHELSLARLGRSALWDKVSFRYGCANDRFKNEPAKKRNRFRP